MLGDLGTDRNPRRTLPHLVVDTRRGHRRDLPNAPGRPSRLDSHVATALPDGALANGRHVARALTRDELIQAEKVEGIGPGQAQ